MENFERNLRKLLADKLAAHKHPLEPSQRESLEVLLEHIQEKVLVPAHRILIAQEAFTDSTLVGDDVQLEDEDGLEYRKMVNLTVVRNGQALFEYRLSFQGETEDTEDRIWCEVLFSTHPQGWDSLLESWDSDTKTPEWQENMPGRTVLPESVVGGFPWQEFFPLDMTEAVRLIQEDFYEVCETVL